MAEADPDEPDLASAAEQLYFLALEKVFIAERGSPLCLSPKDWHVACAWYEAGMPLEWVERKLHEIFAERRARGTVDKVVSLRYCRRSVEAAWKRYQKLAAPQVETPEIDVAARLGALAAALPEGLAARDGWARRLTGLAGSAEEVEARLQELDRELLEAAGTVDPETRSRLEEELRGALANLARRLPAAELAGVEAQLAERLLRDLLALPVLSLFAPEAAPEEEPEV